MNKLTIIGNLTRDPELRTTANGINVCSFTVAVNRRKKQQGQQEADFFRVSAWRQLGENCQKYLLKGRKVAVTGPVSVSSYTANDGTSRFSLEVTADDVEFLSTLKETQQRIEGVYIPENSDDAGFSGFEDVSETDEELPF